MTTLVTRLGDAMTRIATESKQLRTLMNGNEANNAALLTAAKSNLVAAINELKEDLDDLAAASGAVINDAASSSTTETYSIDKIKDVVAVARAALKDEILNGAGSAFDTLAELQALLEGDAASITAINTSLGNRVRYDASQTLSGPQKAQANANIGAAALVDTGTLDTNFVTVFEAGLV